MFPTTVWTTIRKAGEHDRDSLEQLAERYRPPVLRYIANRGFAPEDADDLCQDVFVRILRSGVLARADRGKGRFRSLVLTIAIRVIQDRRRQRHVTAEGFEETAAPATDPEFDRGWVLHLAERAMARLRAQGSPYYQVLKDHLSGEPQVRNKLWIARNKIKELIREEVAFTCANAAELEQEMAYLSPFLRPSENR